MCMIVIVSVDRNVFGMLGTKALTCLEYTLMFEYVPYAGLSHPKIKPSHDLEWRQICQDH